MNIPERLQTFYDFDSEVVEAVTKAAADQAKLSFSELADKYGVGNGPEVIPSTRDYRSFEVLTITPKGEYDETEARIYHLPINLTVDPGMAMRGIRMFAADPTKQLILTGNPSAVGHPHNRLKFSGIKQVWHGDITPTVDPLLTYLGRRGIRKIANIGYSYGADKAAVASSQSPLQRIPITTTQGVFMESVAVDERSLLQLAKDFSAAEPELNVYVAASESPALDQAREASDTGFARYALGLLRASNLAIAMALTKPTFVGRVTNALMQNPGMRAAIARGTASEIDPKHALSPAVDDLKRSVLVGGQVSELVLRGMHHAGGDDINLHAAIVMQGLRLTDPV